jgi:hypothetical protein
MTFRSLDPIHGLDANHTYLHASFTWAEPAVMLRRKSLGFLDTLRSYTVKTQVCLYI